MKQETIARLVRECPDDDDLAKLLHEQLELEKSIRKRRYEIRSQEEQVRKQHEEAMKTLRDQWRLLWENCPHHETTYHPDPAGGSDSHMACNLCGKEM